MDDALPGQELCQTHSEQQRGRTQQVVPTSRLRSKSRPPVYHTDRASTDFTDCNHGRGDADMTQFADITQLGSLQNEQPICQEPGQTTSTSSTNEGDSRRPNELSNQTVIQDLQEHTTDEMQERPDIRPGGIQDQFNQDAIRPGGEQHHMQNEHGNQQHQTGPIATVEPTQMDDATPNTVMEADDDAIPHPPRENEFDSAKRRKRTVGGRNKTWYVSAQPGHKKKNCIMLLLQPPISYRRSTTTEKCGASLSKTICSCSLRTRRTNGRT